MFYENGYKIVQREKVSLVAEKKALQHRHTFYDVRTVQLLGIFGYALYYKFFLKPRRLRADIESDEVLSAD